jgi:hypothetical protein
MLNNLIPSGRQFLQFGAVALGTILAVNSLPQLRQILKPNQ